ncbi:uncharacterized protein LOC144633701 isoform X1 [Oculina patagonica]
MNIRLTSLLFTLWFTVSYENVCPEKCTFTSFGKRITVKCAGIQHVSCGKIPSNTIKLDLSDNPLLRFIDEDCFRNLTALKLINLTNDNIKGGFRLPDNVEIVDMVQNKLSLDDLKVIVKGKRKLTQLAIDGNPIGPTLTADVFASLDHMTNLYMRSCNIKYIENGTFVAMRNLKTLVLAGNFLSMLLPGSLHGPANKLKNLDLRWNNLSSIANGTFRSFKSLEKLSLQNNQLRSVPELTGITDISVLNFSQNHIKSLTCFGKFGIRKIYFLFLNENDIEEVPLEVFQNVSIRIIDFSFNKIKSIADGAFRGCKGLLMLLLNFNNISHINARTFSGLGKLQTLMIANNNLTAIPNDTFSETPLHSLFLHNNNIKSAEQRAFHSLGSLQSMTLFNNPLQLLPSGIFDELSSGTKISITCKYFQELPPGKYTAMIKCAPSTSFYMPITTDSRTIKSLQSAGFSCSGCHESLIRGTFNCYNCTFCATGFYSDRTGSCVSCPAGGFYQDLIGQIKCKLCSVGTYVPEGSYPGRRATECRACPYGTLSNTTAGYRACRCLDNFYRKDRFGPCSTCPSSGIVCKNDTAILAPNYYWKWINLTTEESYRRFLENINTPGPGYNHSHSKFLGSLPTPLKCPHLGSCKGGIDSECHEGYRGTLCATCTADHFLRFNTCIKCPIITIAVLSSAGILVLFLAAFMLILWGDSKHASNDRTVADVIMSCIKIVIGFHQVITGIFSALARVHWPITLVAMEKYLKLVEGNILQFAPLSCIDPRFRLDPFLEFALTIGINFLVVLLILLYLLLKKRYINRMEILMSQKMEKISSLKRSCYRNIFLFLLLSYPMTSKKIIHILPLPGVCVKTCFTDDGSECISLLKADYSIPCFTARHNIFWHIAAAFSLYPIAFPLLLLVLIYKYRESQAHKEMAFGLRVFFENYKKRYWFWEIVEMYWKLMLISMILLFETESRSRIGFSVATASAFGIAYTIFRPIKERFEDRLQTYALWVIFFDVCLGAIYSQPDVSDDHSQNKSIFVNVLFVLLNSSVLLLTLGKGLVYMRYFWRKVVSSCLVRCSQLICQGCRALKRKATRRRQDFSSNFTAAFIDELVQPLTGDN